MKNPPRRTNLEQMANRRRGFSTLSRSRGLARLYRPPAAVVCPTNPFLVLRPDRRPDYHMRQFPRVGQGDMIPAGIVGRDPGPPGGVARRADGSHTGLPPCRHPVGRGEHLQLHAPVPGEGRAPLQPHHGDLQPPAPQSISVDERPIVPAARVQVSVFPRLPQARPLATVHAGLSAGYVENCSSPGASTSELRSDGKLKHASPYATSTGARWRASSRPFHLRMTSSSRFSASAKANRPAHNSMFAGMLRPAASNASAAFTPKRPPVEAAIWRSSGSLLPYSRISSS